jgi:hypothetical protein
MKTNLKSDDGQTKIRSDDKTLSFKASETMIRDNKSLRVRSGLRAGYILKWPKID